MCKENERQEWVKRLAQNGWVNLSLLTDSLEVTLTEEVNRVESNAMALKLIERLADAGDEDYMRDEGDTAFIGIPAIFKHYALWIMDVASMACIDCSQDDGADDWVTDAMPKTQAIIWALTDIAGDFMAEASAKMRADHGYSPAEVFVQSINTGESFEQSKTRIAYGAKGISLVEQPPKS